MKRKKNEKHIKIVRPTIGTILVTKEKKIKNRKK